MKINQNSNFGYHNSGARTPGNIKFIVIHYVGATGDAEANINYYNQPTVTNASADFYIGHNGDVWQYNTQLESRYCWHCGTKYTYKHSECRNPNSIGIEMCVKNGNGNYNANSKGWYFTQATIDSAIELTKYLMDKYNIPASNVIRHYDVTGKLCPGVIGWNPASGDESKWNEFKKRLGSTTSSTSTPGADVIYRVRKSWGDSASQLGAYSSLENAKKVADQNKGYFVFNDKGEVVYPSSPGYMVKVTVDELNIRAGAGVEYKINGVIKDKGTYTIVEEKMNGTTKWGKLKSGAGWISLYYTKKV